MASRRQPQLCGDGVDGDGILHGFQMDSQLETLQTAGSNLLD